MNQSTSGLRLSPREEQSEKQRLINDIYKETPSLWAEDVLGVPLDPWQIKMLDSDSNRICLNIHRQGGKSAMSSLICLHTAIFKPRSLSLIIAPALRQSQENFKKIADYISLLPNPPGFNEHTKLSLQFENGSRILTLPGGNEGKTIRGFSRPDVIVEDEAAQCSDELFDAIIPMMTTYPECKFILCSTPFGQRGHFYEIFNKNPSWEKLTLKAEDNARISKDFLTEMKELRGPYVFAQEFGCEFVASDTQLISHEAILRAHNTAIPIIEI